ncbi:MAG TPA: NAD(P)H:quinone oxidoreductase [Candidatus Lustribacter sp.]
MANIAVIYYSSTGNAYVVAQAIEAGARSLGAEVRLRKVRELAPAEAIASNKGWEQHRVATQHVAEATLADLEWADGFAFGTPTRFGAMSAQLKQFLDTSGGLWMKGLLADKAATAFVGASHAHGGQETTLLTIYNMMYHWGAIIVPPSYTDPSIAKAGGNPYGTSYTDPRGGDLPPEVLAAARYQGARLARYATVLAANRAALRGA